MEKQWTLQELLSEITTFKTQKEKTVIFDRDTNIIISVKNLAEVEQILPWRMLNLNVRYWEISTYDGITIILDCVVKIEK